MSANSPWSWFKSWGLWLLLAIAGLIYFLFRILPSDGKKPAIIQKAKDGAKKLKDSVSAGLVEHSKRMDERREELEKIEAIEDEKERLKQLAEFANRR